MNNIIKNVILLLACALCAGLAKAQVTGTPYIANGCPAPDAPGEITFSPVLPIVANQGDAFTATVPNVADMTYTWSLPAGLSGTSTTNSITITSPTGGSYDASAITVTATNASGCTSAATAGTHVDCLDIVVLRNDIPSLTIGGVTWATKNVGAPGTFTANAGDPGMLYQWDRNIGWSSSDPMTSIPAGNTWNSIGSTATAWDLTNNNPCPTGWSVPTDAQLTALNNTGSVWIDGCTVAKLGLGTLPGRIYGTTTAPATYADYNSNSMLFLPANGYRYITNGVHYYAGQQGYYWGSTYYTNGLRPSILKFDSSTLTRTYDWPPAYAASIRCVQ